MSRQTLHNYLVYYEIYNSDSREWERGNISSSLLHPINLKDTDEIKNRIGIQCINRLGTVNIVNIMSLSATEEITT